MAGLSGTGGMEGNGVLEPTLRVVVEAKGGRVGVQANVPHPVAINLLKDAMVALAQAMVREENKTLVKPVGPGGAILLGPGAGSVTKGGPMPPSNPPGA